MSKSQAKEKETPSAIVQDTPTEATEAAILAVLEINYCT